MQKKEARLFSQYAFSREIQQSSEIAIIRKPPIKLAIHIFPISTVYPNPILSHPSNIYPLYFALLPLNHSLNRLFPRPSILTHPPLLNIPLDLVTPILPASHRLAPSSPIRHDARPRALHKLRVLEIVTVFAWPASSDLCRCLKGREEGC
jgi:hypothetical protein